MPIYEYRCEDCGKKCSFLVLKRGVPFHGRCAHCGSRKLRSVVSRFGLIRSEESRLESLADPSKWGDVDENDPRSISRWMKRVGKEMGEDLGEDFDQMVEEAEQEAATGEKDTEE